MMSDNPLPELDVAMRFWAWLGIRQLERYANGLPAGGYGGMR